MADSGVGVYTDAAMLGTRSVMALVATTDPERARAFYQDTLGLPLVSDEPWALVFSAAGTMLRVQKVERHAPHPFTALGWHVPDVADDVAALASRGVRFERYEGMQQDDAGIWTSPSGARVAWFKDPDGNLLSLTQGAGAPLAARLDNVVPEIFVDDGPRAVAFYCGAFGALERSRMMTPDGKKLVHGEIEIGGHRVFVVDEFLDVGSCRCPKTLGGTGVRITLEVADADAFVARAVACGAKVTMPVADMFWGARYGKLVDPFGHEWGVNEQRQRISPAQEAANAERFFAEKGREG
jgi:uncharacterized glyoxalase superfamily protein PhnB